jgi:hypothetical protein
MDKLMQLIACEARSEGIYYDTARPYLDDEILLYGTRVLLDLMIFVGTWYFNRICQWEFGATAFHHTFFIMHKS